MMQRPNYNQSPRGLLSAGEIPISSFLSDEEKNEDAKTVASFGDEWEKFGTFTDEELATAGQEYFDIVTPEILNEKSLVLDLGCGSGRWSRYIAKSVGHIEAIDPSHSVIPAARMLREFNNVRVTQASVANIPFEDNTFDFLLCLGVLHHIPDTQQALNDAAKKIKPGGHALLYFYYNLENRGMIYRMLFQLVNLLRKVISSMPGKLKRGSCDVIAVMVYLPLVYLSKSIRLLFPKKNWAEKIPLAYYTNKSFHIIRNDALDRFGTPLEKRYSRSEITSMCKIAGLKVVKFSEKQPYWHLVAERV